jgi:formylglycine-generating enzyme required for sulfatase activity
MDLDPTLPTPTPTRLERVIRVCERFEDAWRQGVRPSIEDFLHAAKGCDGTDLLRELLVVELQLQVRAGNRPACADYLERFRLHATAVEAAFKAAGLPTAPEPATESGDGTHQVGVPQTEKEPGKSSVHPVVTALTPAAGAGWPTPSPGPTVVDPVAIGRYRVIRRLSEGGFGIVYLAEDQDLHRPVAIKVPRRSAFDSARQIEMFLHEARMAARLSHPAIVAVYDVGRCQDGSIYIVLEYIDGKTLSDVMKAGELPLERMAGLLARVAEAVHHAHQRGLVHRDLKPANILVDSQGNPRVADFGLALHEDVQRLRLGEVEGTAPYMAPEQVRGETHLLDRRTDVWALGVILYQVLAGRKPFSGATPEVIDEILYRDPRPPRLSDDRVPAELERICLKCLSKRMADRYATTAALAEDLRLFLTHSSPSSVPIAGVPAPAAWAGHGDADAIRVVPKGLRAFDARDADFFLALLPGPRDRHGLPESIRFWKALIETSDPSRTFRVGMIYGPSGCGKSSLVRAGLLPRLSSPVRWVYVEATPDGMETRLLHAVRRAVPGAADGADLVTTLAGLREGGRLAPGDKLLIVLDQFEQWLHARRDEPGEELVAALRQCDGEHVQAVILVRDDFWIAATRFLRDLEIRLIEGENTAAVDLFDPPHARRVLTLFGRAFGVLPAEGGDLPAEQAAFLEQSIAGLARDGKVIPVRLALFAQMVKGHEWTLATLRAVGGAQGIGANFLEATFASPGAPLKHRLHQRAAQAVLQALLPESGSDIKGQMRSESQLQQASGYAGRHDDFDNLLRTLDGELRLITPTDPAAADGNGPRDQPRAERYYQLTHDYLVPSLRDWLTRKRRETPRGRAKLTLEEHAGLWSVRPLTRLLPSLLDWAGIVILTRHRDWTEPQRRMMRRAGWFHGLRLLATAAVVSGAAAAGLAVWHQVTEANRAARGRSLVEQLLLAETPGVPKITEAMEGYRRWTDPELRRLLAGPELDPARRLRVSLSLLPVDPGQVNYLAGRLPGATSAEFAVIRDALTPQARVLAPGFWSQLQVARPDDPSVLPLAGSLARFDPGGTGWATAGEKTARALIGVNPIFLGTWIDALRPVGKALEPTLVAAYRDRDRPEGERAVAADLLSEYAGHDAALLADLIMDAEPKEFARLFPVAVPLDGSTRAWEAELARAPATGNIGDAPEPARDRAAARRARAAIALARAGRPAAAWQLLRHNADPRVRSALVNGMQPYGVAPTDVAAEFARLTADGRPQAAAQPAASEEALFDPQASELRALVLTLGTYDPASFEPAERAALTARLLDLHRSDPDAGVHGAAAWALARWGQTDSLARQDAALRGADRGGRHWFVNRHGQTFVVCGDRLDFPMGSPPGEPGRWPHELLHRRILNRRFAIGTREVSVEQYQRFLDDRHRTEHAALLENRPGPTGPRNGLTWFEAAEYCNWLSRQEGLPEVYVPNPEGAYGEGMAIRADALELTGYRLPTDAEWEYACRAGARTSRYYGNDRSLLRNYAWYNDTSADRPHPCGILMPNDLGLFDMYGNLYEWCQDLALDYHPDPAGTLVDEIRVREVVRNDHNRLLRGGSFLDRLEDCRSAQRDRETPGNSYSTYGFRLARTVR